MKRAEPSTGPWKDIAVDLMGPLPTGEGILLVVDYYNRFYEVVVMHSTTAERVMDALSQIFYRYGCPFTLKSDNDPQFRCEEFTNFLSSHGVEHRTSPPLWPQANGQDERQNRTLYKSLKVAHVEGRD